MLLLISSRTSVRIPLSSETTCLHGCVDSATEAAGVVVVIEEEEEDLVLPDTVLQGTAHTHTSKVKAREPMAKKDLILRIKLPQQTLSVPSWQE